MKERRHFSARCLAALLTWPVGLCASAPTPPRGMPAWIERLEQLLLARDRLDGERVHVLAHLEQAREVYRAMLK